MLPQQNAKRARLDSNQRCFIVGDLQSLAFATRRTDPCRSYRLSESTHLAVLHAHGFLDTLYFSDLLTMLFGMRHICSLPEANGRSRTRNRHQPMLTLLFHFSYVCSFPCKKNDILNICCNEPKLSTVLVLPVTINGCAVALMTVRSMDSQ